MKVEIVEPVKKLTFEEIIKVRGETEIGWFSFLPRHIDCTVSLLPGIVELEQNGGGTAYVGIDEGIFIKKGDSVRIATGNAVYAKEFENIVTAVEEQFKAFDERDKKLRSVLTKMETELSRKLLDSSEV